MKKPKHGGARVGTGPKVSERGALIQTRIQLYPDQIEWLKSRGASMSATTREALDEKIKSEATKP